MACESAPQLPPEQAMCTANRNPQHLAVTRLCNFDNYWYGEPGGHICQHCPSLAHCPGGAHRPDWSACPPSSDTTVHRAVLETPSWGWLHSY
jgi:hypothetical protein